MKKDEKFFGEKWERLFYRVALALGVGSHLILSMRDISCGYLLEDFRCVENLYLIGNLRSKYLITSLRDTFPRWGNAVNLRKNKSISLRAACFILPQNYRTCHPERSRRISQSVRHFVFYLSNIYVIFSSVYIDKIHSRLLH